MRFLEIKKYLLCLFLMFSSNELIAQLYSTVGKEFCFTIPRLYTFLDNIYANAKLIITSTNNCTINLHNSNSSYTQNFNILSSRQNVIDLPIDIFYQGNFETIDNKAAFISSSDSIQAVLSVAGANNTIDLTNLIPIQSLGSDYMVLTYAYGGPTSVTRSKSQFVIVGVEDNTIVKISPSQISNIGTLSLPFNIRLNKGETFVFQGYQDLDLTGSTIHSEGCKKIAVFSGAEFSYISTGCSKVKNGNLLLEQNSPINTLGTLFLFSSAPNMEKEGYKVLATQDNTKVFVNGVLKTVLNRGNYFEDFFSNDIIIKTNKPVTVAYLGLSFCDTKQENGGAFISYVTPFEQAIKNSKIITSVSPPAINKQFLQIHLLSKDKNFTIINGKNVGNNFKSFSSNPAYSFLQLELDTTVHSISNSNGFTAQVCGNGTNTFGTSYGYSAGSLLNKSNQYASVNGNSSNLQKEFLFCPMQAVNFEAVRQDTVFSKVFWHFDDGSIDSGNVVNKTFKDTGCHQVQMISYYSGSSGNCLLGNGATDTTFLKVCVVNSLPLSIGNDTGFCRNRPLTLQSNINPDGFSYLWSTGATSSAISVTETGNYWLELKNGNCAIRDSVQVTVVDKPVLSIQGDKLLCSGDSILLQNSVNSPTVNYTWNNGKKGYSQWINKPGLYSLSGMDRGCYAETSINIGELSCPEIYVPTGFTPDGDGRNDIIRPICAGIDLVYFRVYNRYGQMIFETREDGKGWNGKLNGIQQSMATYVYVVEGRDKSGRQHIRKGTFVLIR